MEIEYGSRPDTDRWLTPILLLATDTVWSELENFETFQEKEHLPAFQRRAEVFRKCNPKWLPVSNSESGLCRAVHAMCPSASGQDQCSRPARASPVLVWKRTLRSCHRWTAASHNR